MQTPDTPALLPNQTEFIIHLHFVRSRRAQPKKKSATKKNLERAIATEKKKQRQPNSTGHIFVEYDDNSYVTYRKKKVSSILRVCCQTQSQLQRVHKAVKILRDAICITYEKFF